MFQTPILLIVFNRPDLTQLVFNEIRKIKPAQLFVSADGPRTHVATDREKCDACLSIIKQVDWECEVKILRQDKNLGCGKAVSTGISWFFKQVEQGIILEDDCIPNPSFFSFCEQLLLLYKDNEQIMHIGGTNVQLGLKRGENSYYFSAIPHVWGWASWRRAWNKYTFDITDFSEFKSKKKINKYFSDKKIVKHWLKVFEQMKDHKIDTWDHQWSYSIWNNGGLTIIPQRNLISNIGFREDATHTFGESPYSNMESFELGNLVHPEVIEHNKEADAYTFYSHHRQEELSILQRIKRKLKTYLTQG